MDNPVASWAIPEHLMDHVCPRCHEPPDTHPSGDCLNRWVHEAFFGKTLGPDERPPYYENEGLDDLGDVPVAVEI